MRPNAQGRWVHSVLARSPVPSRACRVTEEMISKIAAASVENYKLGCPSQGGGRKFDEWLTRPATPPNLGAS